MLESCCARKGTAVVFVHFGGRERPLEDLLAEQAPLTDTHAEASGSDAASDAATTIRAAILPRSTG